MTTGRLDLVETMRHDVYEGIVGLDRHLARLTASARALGFTLDRHQARNELQAATFGRGPSLVRLVVARSGAIAVEVRPLPAPPAEPVPVAIVPLPFAAGDARLRHPVDRTLGECEASTAAGAFDLLFERADGLLTQGRFTSLFVERDGRLLTPPVELGLRAGVLRERLLEEGRAVEAELRREDLEGGFYVGNSVIGLVRANPILP